MARFLGLHRLSLSEILFFVLFLVLFFSVCLFDAVNSNEDFFYFYICIYNLYSLISIESNGAANLKCCLNFKRILKKRCTDRGKESDRASETRNYIQIELCITIGNFGVKKKKCYSSNSLSVQMKFNSIFGLA